MQQPQASEAGPLGDMLLFAGAHGARQMEGPPKNSACFIGTIERFADGWRASYRLRVPGEAFTQPGDAEIFASELKATKWLHAQAAARGFSSIELRCHG